MFTDLGEWLGEQCSRCSKNLGEFAKEAFKWFEDNVLGEALELFDGVAGDFNKAAKFFGKVGADIGDISKGLVNQMGATTEQAVGAVVDMMNEIYNQFPEDFMEAFDKVGGLAKTSPSLTRPTTMLRNEQFARSSSTSPRAPTSTTWAATGARPRRC